MSDLLEVLEEDILNTCDHKDFHSWEFFDKEILADAFDKSYWLFRINLFSGDANKFIEDIYNRINGTQNTISQYFSDETHYAIVRNGGYGDGKNGVFNLELTKEKYEEFRKKIIKSFVMYVLNSPHDEPIIFKSLRV